MLAVHLKQGMTRHIILPNQLEKGMVVYFRYKKVDGSPRQYVATVLNGNWQGKLHALSMNEIQLPAFREFAKGFGIRYIPAFQKTRGVDLPKIDMSASSKVIYTGKVKPDLAKKLNNSYRTLILKNISGLQLLDYDFGPELQKQLEIS
tara:strand:- start:818 stop:1261 length:444 start_codon:yes stop_codon:yes gene_type:complete